MPPAARARIESGDPIPCFRTSARYCCAMPEDDKRETAEALMCAMELEVAQKRAQWQRDRETHRLIRLLGFSFLSLVILGALVFLFFLLSNGDELRSRRASLPSPNRSPYPNPPPEAAEESPSVASHRMDAKRAIQR